MLRETDPQTTLWEALLPEQAKRLPAELAKIDAYLDDERFMRWPTRSRGGGSAVSVWTGRCRIRPPWSSWSAVLALR